MSRRKSGHPGRLLPGVHNWILKICHKWNYGLQYQFRELPYIVSIIYTGSLLDQSLRTFRVNFACMKKIFKFIAKNGQLGGNCIINPKNNPKFDFIVMSALYKCREDLMNVWFMAKNQSDASCEFAWKRILNSWDFTAMSVLSSISRTSDERFNGFEVILRKPSAKFQPGGCCPVGYARIEVHNNNLRWGFTITSLMFQFCIDQRFQSYMLETLRQSGGCCLIRNLRNDPKNVTRRATWQRVWV